MSSVGYDDSEPEPKRRRVRKGTHSCWECKRRKVRCNFASAADTICITCRRRGTKCVSQELPEEQHVDAADRIERGAEETPSRTTHTRAPPASRISQALLEAFPVRKDVDILLEKCTGISQFCHQVNDMPHTQDTGGKLEIKAKLTESVSPLTHPVLVAKQMLMLSSLIAHFPPQQHISGLSEHHRVTMERLAETAISLVTTNEELLGPMEILECILLEGLYHLNCGNIRRGWLAHRRAMVAAQLSGIHRPRCPPVKTINSDTDIDPTYMWSHIVYLERFLSLILGLPSGQPDVRLDSDLTLTRVTSSDRLERCHARITGRILERNQLGVSQHVRDLTLDIDKELRMTAESLPADFWRPPDFTGIDLDSDEAFRETMRIRDQVTHYTLLNQLHLPFLMCPSRCEIQYSQSSCVYASREVLTRFIAFRSINNSWSCCRLADFLALIAGMTLMIIHLDSHQHIGKDNLLAHQRLGDRATVKQALKIMELNSEVHEDMLSAKCAGLLQNLLRTEAASQRFRSHGDEGHQEDVEDALFVTVPYFGTIRIGRDGIKSAAKTPPQPLQNPEADITIGGIGSVHFGDSVVARDTGLSVADVSTGCGSMPSQSRLPAFQPQPQHDELHTETDSVDLPSAAQDLYTGAAGVNDWAFQGIDTAFFDNLLMGTDMQVGDGTVASWDRNAPGG
ncbi:putative Zn(II)2Cys6 transcription factor [Exophiala viscosa]|uniref:putative Zn(II)2Cys6 transcription factor n=1 Tax=Exophiala viscosa TaxID=2486360 RepID=UPI00218E2609|nr:putative Zn(II)2Cys6 transcription factor [Exophiala viscosa]